MQGTHTREKSAEIVKAHPQGCVKCGGREAGASMFFEELALRGVVTSRLAASAAHVPGILAELQTTLEGASEAFPATLVWL